MGQFMDHDMTFDLTSRLGVPTPPEEAVNTRTPAFDLDSVYGGGPDDDPDLYTFERGHAPMFKIGFGGPLRRPPPHREPDRSHCRPTQ
jgi:hypothetical protein